MARCATIEPAQSEAAIIALGDNNNACEGRIYPITDHSKIYVGVSDGTVFGPLPGTGGGGSSAAEWETVTLTIANEVDIVLAYQGTAPSLAKLNDGVFEITIPANTIIKGYHATSLANITYAASNNIRIRMVDGDAKRLYGNYSVLQQSTGEEAEEFVGVIEKQTLPAAATVQVEFPNMSALSGGFVIISSIVV